MQALSDMENHLKSMAVAQPSLTSNSIYNRIAARDWALSNVWDAPEDNPGLWYGAKVKGGWPGKHWFRTGNGTDGGVVPYMVKKNYFYPENDLTKINAGCIMSWVNISHVALVTYGDSITIKYTAHSQPVENAIYRTDLPANFYMYH